jgi:hypothetical protein
LIRAYEKKSCGYKSTSHAAQTVQVQRLALHRSLMRIRFAWVCIFADYQRERFKHHGGAVNIRPGGMHCATEQAALAIAADCASPWQRLPQQWHCFSS